jgi:hypothetical protein
MVGVTGAGKDGGSFSWNYRLAHGIRFCATVSGKQDGYAKKTFRLLEKISKSTRFRREGPGRFRCEGGHTPSRRAAQTVPCDCGDGLDYRLFCVEGAAIDIGPI